MSAFIPDVAWLKDYEVGFAPIDDDHKNMVKLVNQTARALNAGDLGQALTLLTRFIEISRYHFEHEERILRESRYPDLDHHVGYHEKLLATAEDVAHQCETVKQFEFVRESFMVLVGCLLDDVIKGDANFG
jgi:hemerythrin-like metal-binding protein